MNKKILFVTSNLNIGGAQRFIVNLANDLDGGYEVHLINIQENGFLNLEDNLNDDIRYQVIGKRALKSIWSLSKEIKRIKPDIIFSTQSYINSVLLFSKILSGYNCRVIIREASIISNRKDPIYWVAKIMYGHADMIIAQTSLVKEAIVKNYNCSPRKVKVLPNYIDYNLISKKAELGINITNNSQKIIFLFCGRLEKVKNVDFLIETLGDVYNDGYDFDFWIVGDGSEKERLELEYASEKYRFVNFLGLKKNPYPYMKVADCLLLASDREGFPNVVVEAMALKSLVLINAFRGGAAYDLLPCSLGEYIYSDKEEFEERVKKILQLKEFELENLKLKFREASQVFKKENLIDQYIS
jgi:glycosyltransferase involved in cell wall biosynthesis